MASDDKGTARPGQSWRARMRAAAAEEIKTVARRILVEQGPGQLTIRAVAREMGLTSPAIYRYFASYDELVEALTVDLFAELTQHVRAATQRRRNQDGTEQLLGASRAFRTWALRHPREFQFMLVSPILWEEVGENQRQARTEFGSVFLALFGQVWNGREDAAAPRGDCPPDVIAKIEQFCDRCGVPLCREAAVVAIRCWVRLWGIVCMEAAGHLSAIGRRARTALFEQTMSDVLHELRC
ncbi:TetR family transcriptional regulator [Longimycelium tulufanense]|uniref:TetR family transcriptional regulator n=1 Tax=Longimycelium tulufanense TaxID=907463 RepID=A0A8J3C9L9_9PSEU|nr:TetR/AcrR family transcriptional regulator [Longimycelium tulufanense]GGM46280.1 TetR family transcriptional regulator [Longimycelium tulufanense]